MTSLSKKDRELVAIGASLASNCIPCAVYHFAEAKKLGISDEQLSEAIEVAVTVRKAPADRVVETARAQLDGAASEATENADGDCSGGCC